MRTVAIIQARMNSTRLPGKVLEDIGGAPMLARVVARTARASTIDALVVATSASGLDDAVAAACRRLNVAIFRGSEEDVLDRYHNAAETYCADAVVRITADNPLVDPEIIDRVTRVFLEQTPDYAGNVTPRTYPLGLDVEVIARPALAQAWTEAIKPYHRAHVDEYLLENPQRFRLVSVTNDRDLSGMRWTVDTPEDLEFAREVYARFGNDDRMRWTDVAALIEREPSLADINRHVHQKTAQKL